MRQRRSWSAIDLHEYVTDKRKEKEELKTKRNRLFDQFLKDPQYFIGFRNQDNRRSGRGIHKEQCPKTTHPESRLANESKPLNCAPNES
jgi:hypothetical protein